MALKQIITPRAFNCPACNAVNDLTHQLKAMCQLQARLTIQQVLDDVLPCCRSLDELGGKLQKLAEKRK